jgi:hypothetical protein
MLPQFVGGQKLILTARDRVSRMREKTVPEIIDPVFAKTIQNARFLLSENERFGLVFMKTGSINSGTVDTEDAIQEGYIFRLK